ncbi:hypothetical protein TSH100_04155 [Azospirillum sp. TSH100]|uniref:hypothetical protein n=1 Tax=Azospirillum sp. TSH100 TaxID=652764 RepID=UPI000D6112B4|nr:hypothetical protein [Azospirillum sp. TSH100]PWC89837.1 hypothetical protein TSH100_04155 [Azospirillum sp. TSH100]QCG92316.1 hypothetical protein E6C72_31410 [Azospirillum sp. TSH100]
MGKHIVIKPFNTPTRRFSIGQEVTERDIDGVLTLADWVRLEHLAIIEEVSEEPAAVDPPSAIAAPTDPQPDTMLPVDELAPATADSTETASAD